MGKSISWQVGDVTPLDKIPFPKVEEGAWGGKCVGSTDTGLASANCSTLYKVPFCTQKFQALPLSHCLPGGQSR